MDLIHTDVCSKIAPSSLGGPNYFLTFIDEATKFTWVHFLKTNDEVFTKYKEWEVFVEKQFDRNVKIIHSDNGGEYISNVFENHLKTEGIKHEHTCLKNSWTIWSCRTYESNISWKCWCMLSGSKLPKSFWPEALATAVYVKNRNPANSLKDKTPYEALFDLKPSVKHIKTFGFICFVHIPKDECQKVDIKSSRGVFVGYASESKANRVYDQRIYTCYRRTTMS